jgi:hypothetical protein
MSESILFTVALIVFGAGAVLVGSWIVRAPSSHEHELPIVFTPGYDRVFKLDDDHDVPFADARADADTPPPMLETRAAPLSLPDGSDASHPVGRATPASTLVGAAVASAAPDVADSAPVTSLSTARGNGMFGWLRFGRKAAPAPESSADADFSSYPVAYADEGVVSEPVASVDPRAAAGDTASPEAHETSHEPLAAAGAPTPLLPVRDDVVARDEAETVAPSTIALSDVVVDDDDAEDVGSPIAAARRREIAEDARRAALAAAQERPRELDVANNGDVANDGLIKVNIEHGVGDFAETPRTEDNDLESDLQAMLAQVDNELHDAERRASAWAVELSGTRRETMNVSERARLLDLYLLMPDDPQAAEILRRVANEDPDLGPTARRALGIAAA